MKLKELIKESVIPSTIPEFMDLLQRKQHEHAQEIGLIKLYPKWKENNGKIDIIGDVKIPPNLPLKDGHLPFKFGVVEGTFSCMFNRNLTSFENCPDEVYDSFFASGVGVHSIKGCPSKIGAHSRHTPQIEIDSPNLKSFVGISEYMKELNGGNFLFQREAITEGGIGLLLIKGLKYLNPVGLDHGGDAFTIIKKYFDNDRDNMFECQAELIDAGFEAHAQL